MNQIVMLCVASGLLLSASPAQALMTPISQNRFTSAIVDFLGDYQIQEEHPTTPFGYFKSLVEILIENPDPEGAGSCQSAAFQSSQFYPTLIQASGSASGYWVVVPGTYSAASISGFRFHLDTCVEYTLDVWLEPATVPEACQFLLESSPGGVRYHDAHSGELHLTGQLSPGDYFIEGRASFGTGIEWFEGGTFSYLFQVSPCSSTLIAGQPNAVTIPCNTNGVFTVTPQSPSGSWNYQWRRNGVPLVNSSHIAGATSTQLTVNSACHPDSGYYDVLVSNGTITQPSAPAKLTILNTTGVEPGPLASVTPHIELAGPSPFTAQTALRYSTPDAQPATISIHDITGARVRMLAERVVGGVGVVTWDGRSSTGARAPAGVYYARIESTTGSGACRLVKLN